MCLGQGDEDTAEIRLGWGWKIDICIRVALSRFSLVYPDPKSFEDLKLDLNHQGQSEILSEWCLSVMGACAVLPDEGAFSLRDENYEGTIIMDFP